MPGDAADSDLPTADFITMANSPTVDARRTRRCSRSAASSTRPRAARASGCAAADYAGVSGKIALVQRGTCAFVDEVGSSPQAAGATGVIIYNEGNTPARQNPLFVDNQPEPTRRSPAVITSYTLGNELLQAYKQGKNPTVDFKVYGTFTRPLPAAGDRRDARAATPTTSSIVGAHLDSVPEGPGINDDGSGAATLLDDGPGSSRRPESTAPEDPLHVVRCRGERPRRVELLRREPQPDTEVDKVDVMLDYDMLASAELHPYASTTATATTPGDERHPTGPPGSGKVEQVFDDWFRAHGLPERPGRPSTAARTTSASPSVAFPPGGVFAGAEGIKTAEAGADLRRRRTRVSTQVSFKTGQPDGVGYARRDSERRHR